ncbi:MAG: TetR/AcrR family transcriptional regulator [Chloroflexi bacterium]|nr:TetR/AcrR family transcriptional regulator [Chloroflexota bacterium]
MLRRGIPKDPENTKARILDAALDVFSTKGYHDTTVDEIVEVSDTSKGSVYFHFPNKQRLFLALVDRFADLLERRVIEAISKHDAGIDRVRAALEACLETFGKYRRLAKILLVQAAGLGVAFEEKRLEVLDRFAALVRTYLDEAIAQGDLDATDSEVVAHAWIGAINAVVIRWVYTGSPSPEQILATLLPNLLRGVGFVEPHVP